MRVVLASASPRRRALLRQIGLEADVVPSTVDEAAGGDEPEVAAERLARRKAAEVAARVPDAVVIGADTIVAAGGEVLGKPRDAGEARAMLRRLSGRPHEVWTGVAVVAPGGAIRSAVGHATVWMRALDEREIAAYVASGEGMDKAGAYGIQGRAALFVERIDGDYFAVVGLPLVTLGRLLAEAGVARPGGGEG